MIYDEDPFRRRPGKSTAGYKMMGEVCLDDEKIWVICLPDTGNPKKPAHRIATDNCIPSTMVRGYDFHEPGAYMGNVGQIANGPAYSEWFHHNRA